ncbi:YiiX/YebB-like N1pC/P60 family cysteine hydrolase [Helicobacter sp. T3_23-1056]
MAHITLQIPTMNTKTRNTKANDKEQQKKNILSKSFVKIIVGISICGGLLLLLWFGYANLTHINAIKSSKPKTLSLQTISLLATISAKSHKGDIIFRKGTNQESALIASISKSHFSHIGIIVSTNPLLIAHATTDDNPTKQNQVIISSGYDFISQAILIGTKRIPLKPPLQDKIAKYALAQEGKDFVLSADKNALYCTTFVRDAIRYASPSFAKQYDSTREVFAFMGGKYLLPSAFWNDERLESIIEITEIILSK